MGDPACVQLSLGPPAALAAGSPLALREGGLCPYVVSAHSSGHTQLCGPTTRTVLAQVRGGATSSVGAGGLRADGKRCCALGSVRGPSQGSAAPARVRHGEPRAGDATDVPVQAGHEHADAALGPLAVRKREERGLGAWPGGVAGP